MKITRINDNTISCIISPEDLREHGIRIDDFFERKKEAVEFIRSTVAKAVLSENFDLAGDLTTMRISVLPDHSLSLLISKENSREQGLAEARKYVKNMLESISEKVTKDVENGASDEDDPIAKLLSDTAAPGKDAKSPERKKSFMFSFYTVRDAMECCRVFYNLEPFESSFYYLSEDDIYFLILRRTEKTPESFERCVLSANEFGELVTSNEQYISFVTEHGICIAENKAVEMFMDVIPGNMIPKVRGKKIAAGHKSEGIKMSLDSGGAGED